ncbi:MAG: DNA repair protein RecO [Gammaproteobacteria bacterium]|nr:DNA repair protein RecO [Gammaproteobacteria bacterium]
MSGARRVQLEPAYLLHHRPYSDSSRVLDLVTLNHGRVTLFARGARRPGSALAAVLQPFQPILVSWTGKADGGTLTAAELAGDPVPLAPARLMSGFYLNELLLKLLSREDTHPEVFELYAGALAGLKEAAGGVAEQVTLRRFEKGLLDALGYGPDLTAEVRTGQPLDPAGYYHFRAEFGVVAAAGPGEGAFEGVELLAVAAGRFEGLPAQRCAKRVLRAALDACLDGRALRSREVMLALRRQENDT